MKYRWVLALPMMMAGSAGHGLKPSSKKFTPQAVVVAKQKLVDLSQVTVRRRQRLVDTLESLFTDFGIASARAAANDLLAGNYDFLRKLERKDRVVLSPVVANLLERFPAETGLTGRLKLDLPTLSKLQSDGDPTVAERAKWLVQAANGKRVPGLSNAAVRDMANSFRRFGRHGLVAYRNISDETMRRLQEKLPVLEALSNDPNPVLVQRAEVLTELAAGQKITGVTAAAAEAMINAFLARGRSGLLDLRLQGGEVMPLLLEKTAELDELAQDTNPVVAERAKLLIALSQNRSVPRTEDTLAAMARSFIKEGRAGLEDYERVSNARVAQLLERLPELEVLAQDPHKGVAQRAKWLIQLAHRENITDRKKNTLLRHVAAFLKRGRAGLALPEAISDERMEQLTAKLPELERLSRDADHTVAQWAKALIQAVNGELPEEYAGSIRSVAGAFVRRGRAGLLDRNTVSSEHVDELRGRLPVLEQLANDDNPIVAEHAKALVRVAMRREVKGYSGELLVKMTKAFLKRGRSGLEDYEEVTKARIAKLASKRSELEALIEDETPIIATRANVLLQLIDGQAIDGYRGIQLIDLINGFQRMGRSGLFNFGTISDDRIAGLHEKTPQLEELTNDENEKVAKRARILLRAANREEVVDRRNTTLYQLVGAFMKRGRAGLLDYDTVGERLLAQLAKRRQVLELIVEDEDEDPTVSGRAKVLLRLADGEQINGYTGGRLRALAGDFVRDGRDGLLSGRALSQRRIAELLDRLPDLEGLAKDQDAVVAERANVLIQLAKQQKVSSVKGPTLRAWSAGFLKRGRAGLLDYEIITDAQLTQLKQRRADLERLQHDDDRTVAERATLLMKAVQGEALTDYSGGWLRKVAAAYMKRGRDGLLDVRGGRGQSHAPGGRG